MKASKYNWLIGAVIVLGAVIVPIVVFFPGLDHLTAQIPGTMFP